MASLILRFRADRWIRHWEHCPRITLVVCWKTRSAPLAAHPPLGTGMGGGGDWEGL